MSDHIAAVRAQAEKWLAIEGYEGHYEVSDAGRVRSLDRLVANGKAMMPCKGRVLKPTPDRHGYMRVLLHKNSKRKIMSVHRLVALTFLGEQIGKVVCHRNGNPGDNCVTNLYWGTLSENMQDALKHGTHGMAKKTHCVRGHEFSDRNTYFTPGTSSPRHCIACRSVRKSKKRALDDE